MDGTITSQTGGCPDSDEETGRKDQVMRIDKTTIVVVVLLLVVVVPIFLLSRQETNQDESLISEQFVTARDQGERYYREAITNANRDNREAALQHYERALEYYQEALKHRPENGEIHNTIGALHHEIGLLVAQEKWEEDVTGYSVDDSLYRLNDAFKNIHTGILVFEVNDPLVMQAVISKARTEGCDVNALNGTVSSDIYMIRGRTRDEFGKAESHFMMAKTLKPRYGAAFQNLGTLFQETGRLEDALVWWRTALQVEPHNRKLQAYLQQYE